jgi:hypothetical protein
MGRSLDHVIGSAAFHCLDRQVLRASVRSEDDGQARIAGVNHGENLEAFDVLQVEIAQDHIVGTFSQTGFHAPTRVSVGDGELGVVLLKQAAAQTNSLQAKTAELEKTLEELGEARAQARKPKEALAVSRRLKWIRNGIDAGAEMKGAERLQRSPWRANRQAGVA